MEPHIRSFKNEFISANIISPLFEEFYHVEEGIKRAKR